MENTGIELHYRTIGSGPPLVILHGLFGSGDNWLTLAREWSAHYTVYLPDMRNHGRSPWTNGIDYPSMAGDVVGLLDAHHLTQALILGHSMGGKVGMTLAMYAPERVAALVVVDIAPKLYSLNEHTDLLQTLASLDLTAFQTRTQLDETLAVSIPRMDTRQFILKNIYRSDKGDFAWRMNVGGLLSGLPAIGEDSPFLGRPPIRLPALFVAGGQSNYIRESDEALIVRLFPSARIERIPTAGHWVHNDAPEVLKSLVNDFFAGIEVKG